jgi:phosphatidylglycerophosphatase C
MNREALPRPVGAVSADGPPLAIFDLDGTLVAGDTLLPFVLSYILRRGRPWRALAMPLWLALYAGGLLSARAAKERLLTSCLRGEPAAAIAAHADWFWEAWVQRRLRPDLHARLQEHLRAGHRVVLVSASPDLYVPVLARRLGIAEVVCTRIAIQDGVCLGTIAGDNCKGPAKVAMTQDYLGFNRAPANSYAYGDSPSDQPLLGWVTHGSCV